MNKIFGLVLSVQKEKIEEYCFKKCGKIIVGAMRDDILGNLLPCLEEKCPYESDRLKYGKITEWDGEKEVWIRKLKKEESDE